MQPFYATDRATLYHGDALDVLLQLPAGSVDAVITDPPYSSGGMMRSDRADSTRVKYTGLKKRYDAVLEFNGDNRDGRGWAYWSALWIGAALRVSRPGAVLAMFCDWRQLPAASDSLQAGGFVWRGLVPWVKPDARPQQGRFTGQCEYVVWGTAGPRPIQGAALPGWFVARAPRGDEKLHVTQKPLSVVRELVKIAPAGGLVLDPFAGAGTTGVASILEGRSWVGVEQVEHYARVTVDRITTALQGYRDDGDQGVLAL